MLRQHRPVLGRGPPVVEPHDEFACRRFGNMAQLEIGNRDELGYDGAEPGSPDEDVRFSLATYGHNLPSNVFTLSIAIRPNHELLNFSCFR